MADCKDITWTSFIDGIAARARLLSVGRQADALLAGLHLVAAVWGDIILLRAAARLAKSHHVALNTILDARDTAEAKAWIASLLATRLEDLTVRAVPLPSAAMKPAWNADSERR